MRSKIRLIIALLLVMALTVPFVTATPALAVTTGPNYPGTASSNYESSIYNDVSWSSPGNVVSDNGVNATVTSGWTWHEYTYVLRATNFGFSIPADNTIDGIEVEIERSSDSGEKGSDALVQLTKNGWQRVGSNKADTGTEWPTSMGTATYGGAADLWGTSWTRAQINATTFGVHLAARSQDSSADVRVDFIRITVYYSPTVYHNINASAGANGTITPSGTVPVEEGTDQTFDITPDTGYIVADVVVDTVSQGRLNSYTFTNVTATHDIDATFEDSFKEPSSYDNAGWSNGDGAYASDNDRASGGSGDEIEYYNFNIPAIQAGATIDGIEVAVEGYTTSTRQMDIRLSWNNGGSWWTTGSGDKTTSMPSGSFGVEATRIFGGAADTWNRTWAYNEFTNDNFRVEFDTGSGSGTVYVDQLQVKVHYTPPQEPPEGEYGDAPEDAIAYPSTATIGQFPTCVYAPPALWIYHGNTDSKLYFGPKKDFEIDGDAANCFWGPCFPTYDDDECFNDDDAGLIGGALLAEPYTIDPATGAVVLCTTSDGTPLGQKCTQAWWGTNVDIHVTNQVGTGAPAYVNVLIDWNRDGIWGGASTCATTDDAPEHVMINEIVPDGHSGPLSNLTLTQPNFLIGPNAGYVWARFTITPTMIDPPWDGYWEGADGETEDYLLEVSDNNPDLAPACGLDVVLVLDSSDSITPINVKTPAHTFADALLPVHSLIGVVEFDTNVVPTTLDLTDDATAIGNRIDAIVNQGGTQYTNWEAGLVEATKILENDGYTNDRDDTTHPDLIILITNGAPTASSAGAPDTGQPNIHLDPAIIAADAAKLSASTLPIRIVAVGVQDPTPGELLNLQAISGVTVSPPAPVTKDTDVLDITTDEASTLADVLAGLADECGTIIVEKVTDPPGVTDPFFFTDDVELPNSFTLNTNNNPTKTFSDISSGRQYKVTEAGMPAGWALTSIVCDDGSPGDVGTKTATISLEKDETVTVVFTDEYVAGEGEPGAPGAPGAPGRPGGGGDAVGGEVYPVNKLAVLAPWLGLALFIVIGGGILVVRRRTTR